MREKLWGDGHQGLASPLPEESQWSDSAVVVANQLGRRGFRASVTASCTATNSRHLPQGLLTLVQLGLSPSSPVLGLRQDRRRAPGLCLFPLALGPASRCMVLFGVYWEEGGGSYRVCRALSSILHSVRSCCFPWSASGSFFVLKGSLFTSHCSVLCGRCLCYFLILSALTEVAMFCTLRFYLCIRHKVPDSQWFGFQFYNATKGSAYS